MIIYNIIPPLAPTVYQQQLPAYLPTSPQNQNCEGRFSLDDQENQQKHLSNRIVMLVKQICSLYFFTTIVVQLKELKERQRQQNKQKAIKLGLDPE